MTPGRLIAVVGASGVGKDSVMAGLWSAMHGLHPVRRVITRAPGLGGEEYDAVSEDRFAQMAAEGRFALHWSAHGLRYGIPATVLDELRAGRTCLANLSRGALKEADAVFETLVVLHITARPETLARRLAGRGRETGDEIARRLAQAAQPLPAGLTVVSLSNDGPLDDTVAQAVARLQPASV